jgi:hypothetical protein
MERVNSSMMRYKEIREIDKRFHQMVDRATFKESLGYALA